MTAMSRKSLRLRFHNRLGPSTEQDVAPAEIPASFHAAEESLDDQSTQHQALQPRAGLTPTTACSSEKSSYTCSGSPSGPGLGTIVLLSAVVTRPKPALRGSSAAWGCP